MLNLCRRHWVSLANKEENEVSMNELTINAVSFYLSFRVAQTEMATQIRSGMVISKCLFVEPDTLTTK